MDKFKIINNKTLSRNSILCLICRKKIDRNQDGYHIKYLGSSNHIGCFYSWLNKKINIYTDELKELEIMDSQLRKHMPEILAEHMTK